MIKFTVITVTYNAGGVIQRTLDSVLGQTYPMVEHLIVDGKSEDDTVIKALAYKDVSDRRFKRREVRVVSEPDGGLYYAMNKALAMAAGDYLCFLNAGDCFPDEGTLALIECNAGLNVSQNEGKQLPAVLYGDTDWVDNNGRYLRPRRLKAPERLSWKSFRQGMLVCHQAFYTRADIAKRTLFDTNFRYSADVDWCIRIMKEAARLGLPLVNVRSVIANYQLEGTSTANHRASLRERFSVMRRHYGLFCTVAMHLWFIVRAIIKK